MSEHPPPHKIERYRKRTLSPGEIVAIDKHIARCTDCRASIYDPQEIRATFDLLQSGLKTTTSEPEHLSYEEKKAYLKNESDALEREMVENHITACSQCAAEIASLGNLVSLMEAESATSPKQSFLKRLGAFFSLSSGWTALKAVGFAAVVLIAASVALILFMNRNLETKSNNLAATNSNAPAAATAASRPLANSSQSPAGTVEVVVINKIAGVAGGEQARTISIHKASESVQFEVTVEPSAYKSYSGKLITESNKTIELGTSKIIRSGRAIFDPIQSEQLTSGDYQLVLNGFADNKVLKPTISYRLHIIKE